MDNNRIKIYFLLFFLFGFFCLFSGSIHALEVSYPTISGQDINGSNVELPEFVKYLFDLSMFIGFFAVFLSLVIGGFMYVLSPISPGLQASAKDRITGAISGLLILVSIYLIITTINPSLSVLTVGKLKQAPPIPTVPKAPGVYFHYKNGCSDFNTPNVYTSNLPDLGPLKNSINSVEMVKGIDASYISILYSNLKLWGKCQYLDPNKDCQPMSSFATSASIYPFEYSPNGDGVYFYRKPFFNEDGGYYKITNDQILQQKIYISKLSALQFMAVPEEEQNCITYDINGSCTERETQFLDGENISSIKINGNYLVLLIYIGPNDASLGPWTSCQEFPTVDDVNKQGPKQIKWEGVRNSGGVIPNYVLIFPIKKN